MSCLINPTKDIIQRETFIQFGRLQFVGVRKKYGDFEILYYEASERNLLFRITDNQLSISNSLHKFWKGDNYSDFSFSELNECIDHIEYLTGINAKGYKIQRLEFGLNISTSQIASEIVKCLKTYKKKYPFKDMQDKTQTYGKKCELSEYIIKFYDKSKQVKKVDRIVIPENILRYEVVYEKKRVIPYIKTLEDLRNPEKLIGLVEKSKSYFQNIVMDGITDFSKTDSRGRDLFFAGLEKEFWNIERILSKDKGKEKKVRYKKVCNDVIQSNYKNEIIQAISEKFNELLGS